MSAMPVLELEQAITLTKRTKDGETQELMLSIELLRLPEATDFLNFSIKDQKVGEFLQVFANCSGLSMAIVGKMGGRDTMKVVELISGFLT